MAKKIGDLGFQSRLYANLAVAYCALTTRCDEQGVGAAHAANDLGAQAVCKQAGVAPDALVVLPFLD